MVLLKYGHVYDVKTKTRSLVSPEEDGPPPPYKTAASGLPPRDGSAGAALQVTPPDTTHLVPTFFGTFHTLLYYQPHAWCPYLVNNLITRAGLSLCWIPDTVLGTE